MFQVYTGAYVSLLAPGKTDQTGCRPRKTATCMLHVVYITTHTHDRRKSIGKKKQRTNKKRKEGKKEQRRKRKKKTKKERKERKDKNSEKRQGKKRKQETEKRKKMSYYQTLETD